MKKHTLVSVLTAALLCLGALSFAACTTDDAQDPTTDTATDSVTESSADTAADTAPDTADESSADTSDGTDTAPAEESSDESDTAGESSEESDTDGESADESDGESESDTEPEAEPETAAPRYDYMEAEVLPDVTVDASVYTDLHLTLPADLQITDQDVMDYIDYLCFNSRTALNDGAEMTDEAMKIGDDAYIYYRGEVDGVEFEGGSNWDDESPYALGLGSGAFIPGFEEGLVGVIPAEATKENPVAVHVTFPENYSEELAGKDAVFYVAVEYAIQYDVPTYDVDFVENILMYEWEKDFYASDKARLAEFEAYVRTYLEEDIAEDVENEKINAIWTYLIDTVACQNLPQLELDFYYNAYLSEIEYYYEYYSTYGGESFLEEYPTLEDFAPALVGVEDWKAELTDMSHDMVKKDMITHAIAELEGIEVVTDEEYQAEIDYWVSYYSGYMTEEEIIASMGEIYLRESVFADKMQEWLLDRVTFTFETETETDAEA